MSVPIIDPEFRAFIPPMSETSRVGLEAAILRDGCDNAVVVWRQTNILLDGHHRIDVCHAHNVPYATIYRDFPSRTAAMLWMGHRALNEQRHLDATQQAYVRGKMYELLHMPQGRPFDGNGYREEEEPQPEVPVNAGDVQNKQPAAQPPEPTQPPTPATAEQLAAQFNVSDRTLRRDARFAAGVDAMANATGEQGRQVALSGGLRPLEVAAMASTPTRQIQATVANVANGTHRPPAKRKTRAEKFKKLEGLVNKSVRATDALKRGPQDTHADTILANLQQISYALTAWKEER